jgi:hypothetical protein
LKEIELRDWGHFREYVSEAFGGKIGYVFRGHADRDWTLESTLTRLGQRVSADIRLEFLDAAQLKTFRLRIRGLRGPNPQPLDDNGLWSLGQHYGLCTPLLDWTESVYVAAYFAFENPASCPSSWRTIYALNRVKLQTELSEMEEEGVEFLEPLHDDNNRITAQAGLFTKIPTGSDLESWLTQRGLEHHLTKLYLEDDNRLDAINDLRLMNITGTSIYPDLHGAAITCNMLVETVSENYELGKSVSKFKELLNAADADKT